MSTRSLGWMKQAACASATEEERSVFTTPARNPAAHEVREVARKFCKGCPVKEQCGQWAMTERWFGGVAAGYAFSFEHSNQRKPPRRIPEYR